MYYFAELNNIILRNTYILYKHTYIGTTLHNFPPASSIQCKNTILSALFTCISSVRMNTV